MSTSRPIWVGTAIDKLVIFMIPLLYSIVSLPFTMWSLAQIMLATTTGIAANIYNWLIFAVVFVFFLSLTILWEPLLSMMFQIVAPFLQIYLISVVLIMNLYLLIWMVTIETWNIYVPIIALFIIYFMQLLFVFLELVSQAFLTVDLVAIVADLYEVMWFFVDIILQLVLVVLTVFPVALTIMVQIFSFLVVLTFESVSFLLDYLVWALTELFVLLTPILAAVVKLVRVFSDLLRKRSIEPGEIGGGGAAGNAFFSELWNQGSNTDWSGNVDRMRYMHNMAMNRPRYELRYEPIRVELSGRNRQFDAGGGGAPRPLHTRVRSSSDPLYTNHTHTQHIYDRHVNAANTGQRQKRSPDSVNTIFEALTSRQNRGSKFVGILYESLHRGMDVLPSVHAQMDLGTRFAGHVCTTKLGFTDCAHALNYYHTEIRHPMRLLERIVPDVTQHPLGKFMLDSIPEENRDHRMWHHEWRRSNAPVSGFANSRELNARLHHRRQATGETGGVETGIDETNVPFPQDLPITSVADCFTTSPRNILCIPQFPPRGWFFPLIRIEVPLDLNRDCPDFHAPPNLEEDGSFSLIEYFYPHIIIWNSITWVRYLLGYLVTIIFLFDSTALEFPFLSWITTLLIWQDPRDVPLNTQLAFCMFAYFYYPVALVFAFYTGAIFLPPIFRGFSNAWFYLIAPLRMWATWRGRLRDWYQEADPRLGYLKLQPPENLADEFFVQPSVSDTAKVALGPTPIIITKRAEDSSERFTKLVGASIADGPAAKPVVEEQDECDLNAISMRIIADREKNRTMQSAQQEIAHSLIDPALVKLERRYSELQSKMQRLVNACNKLGMLERSINAPEKTDLFRLRIFHNTHPRHTYNMTASYMQDMVHNAQVHSRKGAEHEYRRLPNPFL